MNKPYRPMLAEDMDWAKLKYPLGAQPKIDGVRMHNVYGTALGRSMKPLANLYITEQYSQPQFVGLDGELTCGHWNDPELCRNTTSASSTIAGEPQTHWYIFDYLNGTAHLPYEQRYDLAAQYVATLNDDRIRLVPMAICNNEAELRYWQEVWLAQGFEGLIVRNLKAQHKQGRSTIREGGLLRDKGFIDSEILVDEVEEAMENQNEATIDERGFTKRSSHQDNKVGKGMVGAMWGRLLADVVQPTTGQVLFRKDDRIKVGPGELNHEDRIRYWQNGGLVGHIITFKHFPIGVKDKPRFPTYKSHRAPEDME